MKGETGLVGKRFVDRLEVRIYADRAAMGAAAAAAAAEAFRSAIAAKGACRAVFAAAPSQNELLAGLVAAEGVDWRRVTAFHMDEYLDLPEDAPQRFGAFLRDRLFGKLPFGTVHYVAPSGGNAGALAGTASPADGLAARYASLLAAAPVDVVCLGVGENGHVAFNDPPADLQDPLLVREVRLDEACRRQQVNDGCFPSVDAVPRRALTLTVSALMGGERLFCVVPGPTKAAAVKAMLRGPITGYCPASALRRHPRCVLYLDRASAALLD